MAVTYMDLYTYLPWEIKMADNFFYEDDIENEPC